MKANAMTRLPPHIKDLSNRSEGDLNIALINALTSAEIDYISELYERGNVSGLGIAMLMTACVGVGILIGFTLG